MYFVTDPHMHNLLMHMLMLCFCLLLLPVRTAHHPSSCSSSFLSWALSASIQAVCVVLLDLVSTALTSFTNKSLTLCYRVQKKQVAPIASIIETSVWVSLTDQKWSQNVRESGCPEVRASTCLCCLTVGPRNVKIFYLNSHIQEITRRSCSCSRLRAW